MKQEFKDYLRSVGITDALMPRIEFLLQNVETITQESIVQIFISEYLEKDGSRYYEALRIFTTNFCINIYHFLQDESYNVWNLSRYFSKTDTTVTFDVENFNFITSLPSSRLVFESWRDNPEQTVTIKASGHNCKHFFDKIYLECILPRMREQIN